MAEAKVIVNAGVYLRCVKDRVETQYIVDTERVEMERIERDGKSVEEMHTIEEEFEQWNGKNIALIKVVNIEEITTQFIHDFVNDDDMLTEDSVIEEIINDSTLLRCQRLFYDVCGQRREKLQQCFKNRIKVLVQVGLVRWWNEMYFKTGRIIYCGDGGIIIKKNAQAMDVYLNERYVWNQAQRYVCDMMRNVNMHTLFGTEITDENTFYCFNAVVKIDEKKEKTDDAIDNDDDINNDFVATTPESMSDIEIENDAEWETMDVCDIDTNRYKYLNFFIDTEHTMHITDGENIETDDAKEYEVGFYWQCVNQDKFKRDGGDGMKANVNVGIRVAAQFLELMDKHCTVEGEESKRTVQPKHQRMIILGLFHIFNNYGMLSETGEDVYYIGDDETTLMIPIGVNGVEKGKRKTYYDYVFGDGPNFMEILEPYMELCPFETVLNPRFQIQSYEKFITHQFLSEYVCRMDLLGYQFPRMPKSISTAHAFKDGILYMGKPEFRMATEKKEPILKFYEWNDAQQCLKTKFGFYMHQYYDFEARALFDTCMKVANGPREVGMLMRDVMNIRGGQDAMYFVIVILLTQIRGFQGDMRPIFNLSDTNAWDKITDDEWVAVEYFISCLGWMLGIYCDFAVIMWIQGHPASGKSTIMEHFVETVVSKSYKVCPSDRSKHMLQILTQGTDGVVKSADVIVLDDIQKALDKELTARLCSITDSGTAGILTSDPKGKATIELKKWRLGNRNVRCGVAANISIQKAVGTTDETASGIFRRAFRFSFATRVNNPHVDPSYLIGNAETRAALIVIALCFGYKLSIKSKNTPPKVPVIIQQMNDDYESECMDASMNIVYKYVKQRICVTDKNKGLRRADIVQDFQEWCEQKKYDYNKKKAQEFCCQFDKIFVEKTKTEFKECKLFSRLFMCFDCNTVYQWEDVTGAFKLQSLKTLAQVKENALKHNCTCAHTRQECDIGRHRHVYYKLKLLPRINYD